MTLKRRAWIAGTLAVPASAAAWAFARRSRLAPNWVRETIVGGQRVIVSNGVPDHATGDFPNQHDPVSLRAQDHRFTMSARPDPPGTTTPLRMWLFGVAVNGVPFDPSGPFWNRDGGSGWQFEALCPANAVALGIDVNHAHTQGSGMYHYHGLPTGLYWNARRRARGLPLHLLGYAADGFPIYGPEGPSADDDLASPVRRLRSSYRLRGGRRPGGPGGRFDGTFIEDFEYVPGAGDLDECNGRSGPTPEFPDGTYYYVLTDEFPFIPRLYRGRPDPSFRHGPPPGISPPVPPELARYRGQA